MRQDPAANESSRRLAFVPKPIDVRECDGETVRGIDREEREWTTKMKRSALEQMGARATGGTRSLDTILVCSFPYATALSYDHTHEAERAQLVFQRLVIPFGRKSVVDHLL